MLAIRLQRTGRKGHAQFRVVVQDSKRTPSSGRVVAQLGHYNPHTKEAVLNTEKVDYYLKNGAQPSDRVVRLLVAQGVALPKWVNKPATDKARTTRNADKLRKNRPAEEVAEEPVEAQADAEAEATTEEVVETTDAVEESPAEETPQE